MGHRKKCQRLGAGTGLGLPIPATLAAPASYMAWTVRTARLFGGTLCCIRFPTCRRPKPIRTLFAIAWAAPWSRHLRGMVGMDHGSGRKPFYILQLQVKR